MKKPILLVLALAGAVAVVGCGRTAPEEQTLPTAVATAEAVQTPLSQLGTAVAGVVATPFTRTVPLTETAPFTVTTAVTTMRPTPTPGTPTATPTPGPSASLMREAATLQDKLDAFREALAGGDKDAVLKAQKDLHEELPKAEAAAAGDNSKAAEAFRAGLKDLRAALAGDLGKLDSAAKGIAAVSGGPSAMRQSTSTAAATPVQPIANLAQYAKNLSDEIAAFQKAQNDGNISDLLRLQKSLLDDLDRGEAALSNARTPQAQTIRGALEDLRNALSGDAVKFDVAQQKLQQVAGGTGTSTTAKTTTTTKTVDLQPIANDLTNKLESYQRAIENANQEEIAKAQQALADQASKAAAAISGDQSARAAKLRDAITAVREAAAGDRAKIEAAKSALASALSGQ